METADLELNARQGNPAAFGALIREWDRDLRAMVWSVVGSPEATDTVMTSSYQHAFASIGRIDDQAPMKTWLHTICLRAAIDHSRAGAGPSNDPAIGVDGAFASLDGVERLLLMLTAGVGHDFDDAATIVGMPRDTVVATVGRAIDRLRERRSS